MTIEERVERLERQNRHLRLGFVGVVLVAATIFTGAAQRETVPDVVKAKAFHLVTDDGKTLVKIEDTKGLGFGIGGTVTTYAGNGTELVKLTTTTGGAGMVTTLDGKGQKLASLRATGGGQGAVVTYSSKGQKLVELGATSRGGAVTTFNGQGKDLIRLGVTTDGTGLVGVFDPSGRNRRGVLATRP